MTISMWNQKLAKWTCPITLTTILLILLLMLQYVSYYILNMENKHNYAMVTKNHDYLIDTQGCKIPYFHPWDPSILRHIQKIIFYKKYYTKPICNNGIPALYTSSFTSLNLQISSLPYYNITNIRKLNCCYQEIKRITLKGRQERKSFNISGECISVIKPVRMETELIKLTCKINNYTIYTDVFWFFNKRKIAGAKKIKEFEEVPLSVLVVGLDGVSRLNLYRQMPKTVYFLKGIGAVDLEGYTKVGDNTFPNLVPVLTGKSAKELTKTCFLDKYNFDNCTFLWNLYKNKGYVTLLGEDMSWCATFDFFNQPTDYFYGSFDNIATKMIGNKKDENVMDCIGSRMVYQDHLNYIYNFTQRMNLDQTPYFAFFWASSLSHDYVNKLSIGAEDYYQLFKYLYRKNFLNNTVLIVMSDHGQRYGELRNTYQGNMEERLPFAFIRLPGWYQKQFPDAYNNLRNNCGKLTTHFDMHETLVDLLNPYQLKNTEGALYNRGISLFNKIPDSRTCESAGINLHWCPCLETYNMAKDSSEVARIAFFILSSINGYLINHKKCVKLNLVNIMSARLLIHGEKNITAKMNFQDYIVTIRTAPGNAIFESSVRVANLTMNILGIISRLNLYGNQSHCVTNPHLKMYCFCKLV